MKIAQIFGALLAVSVVLSPATAQQTPPQDSGKQPEMKLEVIPVKKSYRVGERLIVKYLLTSLADGTLCFPVPAIEETGSFHGYLTLDAYRRTPGGNEEMKLFISCVWPRHPVEAQLREEIADRWVRLGMWEPCLVPKHDKIYVLNTPGEWVLSATYQPVDLSARERELVSSTGCTAPQASAQSDPVTISVVDSSH